MVKLNRNGSGRLRKTASAGKLKATPRQKIEDQARLLVKDNREADPSITNVYWFPAEEEVRLLELTTEIPISPDGTVHPYRFGSSPRNKLQFPSAIALIRPEEFGQLQLPKGWGTWRKAKELALGR